MGTDSHPIGVFDSGVGGLTVLKALVRRFPEEGFIYLGDTARVPYGAKSARTVERYTLQVASYLVKREVKALVVACNTASALGLAALRQRVTIPVQGVIQPGCRMAARLSRGGLIGVIGTRTTVASGAYPHTLHFLDPALRVTSLACPLFVPLVEEDWVSHAAARMIVEETLRPLVAASVDTLILGCTHYPLLKEVIAGVMGEKVALVDSAEAVAEEMASHLVKGIVRPAPPGSQGRLTYLVTDVADRFQEVATRFLDGVPVSHVEMIDL
ncbi:MAG: glutamate racemase [Magnetococcales bacterium]|nr:glutamate racemase [Magnetococcales bacterium]MBF0157001.1 glutamate racemase [Magnetococcales bacterium]